jgi:ABC-type sugar transport system ATPase subunit
MALLEMRGIVKDFPGVRALDDVSIGMEHGEILGLVGENGAGKSTLMKVLSGVYPCSSYDGEICVDGAVCRISDPAHSERLGIEMIYQEISLHLDMSVAENLLLGRWKKKRGFVCWKALYAQAKEILERIHLDVDPTVPVRALSTSQQQLIAIGRALARNPRLLIMDEPTSSLTESETRSLFHNMQSLKAQGIGIILISHKLDEIMAQTDRIVVMRDGRVVGHHITKETNPEEIVSEMVGRHIHSLYPEKSNLPGETLLELKHYKVRHPVNREKLILDDVCLKLKKGEVLGIAGLVGAGRSELMNALFGLGGLISGRTMLKGREVKISGPRDAAKKGFALITEDRKRNGYVGVASVRSNVVMASYDRVSTRGWVRARLEMELAKEYATKLRIKSAVLGRLVNTLSGGNQQKVVLAKWLMTEPEILLLDDPTRGIDVGTKNEFYRMIDEFAASGMSCIVSSSEMPELMALSNRIIVLAGGKVRGEFERSEFDERRIMNLAMGL